MLKVCRKGDYLTAMPLSQSEDGAIRRAFGLFSSVEARPADADIIQRSSIGGTGIGSYAAAWTG